VFQQQVHRHPNQRVVGERLQTLVPLTGQPTAQPRQLADLIFPESGFLALESLPLRYSGTTGLRGFRGL
jgi:hypothetical protein